MENGEGGGRSFNVRTFLRAIESFRVKGNEPLKKMHDFINENKKQLRRCLNRIFLRKHDADGDNGDSEWNLIGKDEFYKWLKD